MKYKGEMKRVEREIGNKGKLEDIENNIKSKLQKLLLGKINKNRKHLTFLNL